MKNTNISFSLLLLIFLMGACKLDNLHEAEEMLPAPSCDNLVADFNINNNSCSWPCSINFENRSVNGVNYLWEFGDGNMATLSDPEHAYAKPGTYNVKLTVSDENGCEKIIRKDAVIGFQTFEKVLGEESTREIGTQLLALANGGYAIIGSKNDNGGMGLQAAILRLDVDGNQLWEQTYGGFADDRAFAGIETPDEGFVFVGESQNNDTLEKYDAYFHRVFDTGNSWFDNFYVDTVRNTSEEYIYTSDFTSVIQASNGKYVMLGTSSRYNMDDQSSTTSVFLGQTKGIEFTNDFEASLYGRPSGVDQGKQIIETADKSSYVLMGITRLPGESDDDLYLIKVDTSRQLIWEQIFSNVNDVEPNSIVETDDGGFIIVGTKNPYATDSDIAVLKLDPAGNLSWEKTFGGTGKESGAKVIETENGDLVIVGETTSLGAGVSDLYLLRLDKMGDLIWERTFGSVFYEWGIDVIQANDGGFLLLGGKSEQFFNSFRSDILFIKTDDQGNVN
ncbi:MAG: PKD domain-containing protein [Bacteroidia bacterium]|nr:PKD domain-containing protein [Bacteroidia bacterium]